MPAPAPPPSTPPPPGPPAWRSVFVFSGAPPTSHLVLRGRGGDFRWRVFGAFVPFYLEGASNRDPSGLRYADIFVGWTGAVCSVDVLAPDNSVVEAWFNAFPGRPPGMPSPP